MEIMTADNQQNQENEHTKNCRLLAKSLMDRPTEAAIPFDITNPHIRDMLFQAYNGILTLIENGELKYCTCSRKNDANVSVSSWI
ncbi:hypothetical protein HZA96_01855 [Candidatus Woesearchaeota archaeon]|nr:hypothetical protein [Candidatus Woesearchaeota archaeon]